MLVVQKFGGSSVADAARVRNVAKIVTDTYKAGNDVVVVVSAQGDTTRRPDRKGQGTQSPGEQAGDGYAPVGGGTNLDLPIGHGD